VIRIIHKLILVTHKFKIEDRRRKIAKDMDKDRGQNPGIL